MDCSGQSRTVVFLFLSLYVLFDYILYPPHCGRFVNNMPTVFFALLRQDPLHLRRFCVVRSRNKSQLIQTVAKDTTSQTCHSSVHEVKNDARMCLSPTSRSTAAENTNWLGYYANEVHAMANRVGCELHSRLVDLINRQ
jgi:hypothetical protein